MNIKSFLWPVLLVLATSFSAQAQSTYSLQYKVNNLSDGRVYLLSIQGNEFEPLDSCRSRDGLITFALPDTLQAGMYRILFADTLFTDVILNHEDVRLESDLHNLRRSLRVLSSTENSLYYSWWAASGIIDKAISAIAAEGNVLYQASGGVMTPRLDSLQKRALFLNRRMDLITDSLARAARGGLVANIIKAYRPPDYIAYLKTPGAYPYPNAYEFLRDHYFDQLALSDSRLLYTEVIYRSLTNYMSEFGDPPSTENYIRAADTILKRFAPWPLMYDYALEVLVNTFEQSSWEKVFTHLVDTYVQPQACDIAGAETYLARAGAIRNLAIGKPAPSLELTDINGNRFSLYELQRRATLLLFWSSDCPHCHEIMPALRALYEQYHPLGLALVAVSIDTDRAAWAAGVRETDPQWIHVSDLKGPDSELLIQYNTWKTPGFFLLDADKNILAKPYKITQLEIALKSCFN